MPFPAGAKGFLYYHANMRNPLESQVRFRVTEDNDPASFSRGHDLVYDKGYVWHLRLAHIVSHRRQGPLLRLLVHDGLVDEQTINTNDARNPDMRHQRIKRSVNSLSEPFVLKLSLLRPYVTAFVAGRTHKFMVAPPQVFHREKLYDEGTVLVRLERSTLPEHAGRRRVVFRLLKILETPKQVSDPDLDADTTFPAEGELFTKYDRVWYKDVDKMEALRALYDADDGQE
ncbi:hypothetical protein EWM64_g3834 [Hericium alpestre]|uniref:Uncharacterized protein n=1 Tax=Hericium alpestre TaxID=135208 RepID=A0A4Z0A144_9AGAM|nr:hypothetical protein EWM64_g3834 [Hericium alpestre]